MRKTVKFKNKPCIYIETPRRLARKSISSFLHDIEFIFEEKLKPTQCAFSLKKTSDISLLGLLIVYKFISYSSVRKLFIEPKILIPKEIQAEFITYGFLDLITAYMHQKDTGWAYSKLKALEGNNFFLVPKQLNRAQEDKLEHTKCKYIDSISEFYIRHHKPKCIPLVATCIGELIMNFWAHATQESETIVAATGNIESFTLTIADNGEGIVSNLSETLHTTKAETVLAHCIEKGVSSKKDQRKSNFHMGYGLFLVSKLAAANNGTLNIWSQGAHLTCSSQKISVEKCGYWQGTIIELQLSLSDPKSIADLPEYQDYQPRVRVNFGA